MKVVVAGCSISDYTKVEQVYGEILASNIDADYIHEGAGCGSNYRIWRVITRMVMNNEIDENDVVFVQYTELTRQEYWSANIENDDNRFDESRKIKLREQKYNGDIIRWKNDAYTWHKTNQWEMDFFRLKQNFFTSLEFDEERFEYNHFLFHNLMMSRNIKVAYLVPVGIIYGPKKHLFNKNEEIHITEGMTFQYPCIHLQDTGHFNQRGHEYVAKVLEKFIKKKQWI